MAEEILRAVFGSFFGTIGFAMLVHVPWKAWLPSGAIASFSYLVYWVSLRIGLADPTSIFLGAFLGSLAGQLCARKMKMISTIFLTLSIVSFVPGLGLYRCMELLARSETAGGARQGVEAMVSIAMIALGLGMGSFLFRAVVRGHRNG